jgi:eukaryotic-like serine/threonine-protein kinase
VSLNEKKQSTVEFLIRRMQHTSDFPALSESVSAITKIASSERESIVQLSNSILKDFSLTNKILRLVNAAYYRHTTGGNISTVSRAVMVLGFDAVRNIAITVLLFEHLQKNPNANSLKEEFLRTNLAGILGKDVSAKTQICDGEQAFICAMFSNLGRLLCEYYFPEESEQIKSLVRQTDSGESAAMVQVLGITFEELGIEIARSWGFPNVIVSSMRKLPPGSIPKPHAPEERLRVVSCFANELCDVIVDSPSDQRQNNLLKLKDRYSSGISLSDKDLQCTLEMSLKSMAQFARIINLDLQQTNFGKRLRSVITGIKEQLPETAASNNTDNSAITVLSDQAIAGALEGALSADGTMAISPKDVEAVLAAGIQDISNTLVEDFKLNDVLRIILETMYRAKGFRRVILCIRDVKRNTMNGRFGFGPDGMDIAKRFDFDLVGQKDIFRAALSNGADILINDSRVPNMQEHMPEWFMKKVGAETFVLFPLCIKGNPVAMIYADCEHAGDIVIPEKELSLLRTLRNQAILAIKQAG